ncbi:J domain-containing protein [Luteibacter sp. 22Crub2.1]|uniref:J domain-containing protein n=1 Tax=Luteibacter sp. 22Crub2.1 TaxID=1283288 RepID=UPI0009A5D236|nr:J domain-containing protein [Luteibacter sp. 22Crub2.1]SKB29452.1 hypothetical protein SAMN05660880_00389 [Luteibacter sp. 22Crub2.1]
MESSFFAVLGIDPDADERAIRRAYATRLKAIDPAREPAAFATLREAYEEAQAWYRDGAGADVPRQHAVTDDVPPTPATASLDPRDEASAALSSFAGSLVAEPGTGARVLLYRVTQTVRGHVDAPAWFEVLLIAAIAGQDLTRRDEVFAAATQEFHWNEVGRLAELGDHGRWVEHVLVQETGWKALPERVQERVFDAIRAATREDDVRAPHVVAAWPLIARYLGTYRTYLSLRVTNEVLEAWREAFAALPPARRRKLERKAERGAAPAAWWSWIRERFTGGLAWLFYFGMAVRIAVAIFRQLGWMK